MADIEILNSETIDKIAAGEVVERPLSVVKELVENAIDAGASVITIEIEKGGTSKIRISDNGTGIPKEQVRKAFLRHSTSKLRDACELLSVRSLGFRGEALSSIAAVSKVELITKTQDEMLGTLYEIEGAKEVKLEEIGAPNGSTFIIRDLFYNTLPRQKFLKSPKTEGNYITDIVEKLALSHPKIAFQLSVDGKVKISTIGSGKLKDTIYQICGRNITNNLMEIDSQCELFNIKGFVGNSCIFKGNRSYENIFINGRFVKSKAIESAVEEAYVGYLMQHQYPFVCLMIDIDTNLVDVNVHPTKMEVRIDNQNEIVDNISRIIYDKLHGVDDIRAVTIDDSSDIYVGDSAEVVSKDSKTDIISTYHNIDKVDDQKQIKKETIIEPYETKSLQESVDEVKSIINKEVKPEAVNESQLSFLSKQAAVKHKIIGQLFSTYWLVEYDNSLYIIDQHAAHEKVLYEKTLSKVHDNKMTSQLISPPVIVTLNAAEESFVNDNLDVFDQLGYEIEHYGDREYAINGIPYNIYGVDAKSLFLDLIGDCSDSKLKGDNTIILEKIASMSCKAAVKGNMDLSYSEAKELIDELLTLDNPFHCPHGRPTIIKMTKYEIEKKFGRIQ